MFPSDLFKRDQVPVPITSHDVLLPLLLLLGKRDLGKAFLTNALDVNISLFSRLFGVEKYACRVCRNDILLFLFLFICLLVQGLINLSEKTYYAIHQILFATSSRQI